MGKKCPLLPRVSKRTCMVTQEVSPMLECWVTKPSISLLVDGSTTTHITHEDMVAMEETSIGFEWLKLNFYFINIKVLYHFSSLTVLFNMGTVNFFVNFTFLWELYFSTLDYLLHTIYTADKNLLHLFGEFATGPISSEKIVFSSRPRVQCSCRSN